MTHRTDSTIKHSLALALTALLTAGMTGCIKTESKDDDDTIKPPIIPSGSDECEDDGGTHGSSPE